MTDLKQGQAARLDADWPAAETKALEELNTRLADTIQGLDTVLEKAEPDFRPIAAAFRQLHIRQSATVAGMLQTLGHDAPQDAGNAGSIFGTVNSAVVTVRSWFDEISSNIMDALVEGEKHVLEAYVEAIAASTDPEQRRQLSDDRQALIDLLDRHAPPKG